MTSPTSAPSSSLRRSVVATIWLAVDTGIRSEQEFDDDAGFRWAVGRLDLHLLKRQLAS